ncbi:hypothetical protein [Pseudotamlana agarivorans]|uniref:hypothetical protein n=1 Tax=Pseudotamlana agarivorans TaxID=481183 RepID=UPI00082FE9CA|nr:hypothetical protein [Tamlana agarivorans]
MTYRITKFDPKKRNKEGHFLDNSEWTAISDIGKSKYRNVDYEEYEQTETAYAESIKLILDEKNISSLKIDSLELHDSFDDYENYKKNGRLKNIDVDYNNEIDILENGTILNLTQIQKMIRLILRETIWMNLLESEFKITFGYDYYMYVECSKLTNSTIKRIGEMGLFVEPNMGQRTIIVTDEKGNKI